MILRECFEYMASRKGDAIVVTSAGRSSGIWWDVTRDDGHAFYLNASMSLSSMFASGIAAGFPDRPVWAFSGDGAFVMNTGMLFVERQMNLPNLKHFLIANGTYASTHEVDIPFGRDADYAQMAKAAGISSVYRFSDLNEFKESFDETVLAHGHTFIVLDIHEHGSRVRTPSVDGPELKFRFGRHIEKLTGAKLFTS
jgi:thiamine pyrophosphate-dependent acetolactate synthase large subunit-like protein